MQHTVILEKLSPLASDLTREFCAFSDEQLYRPTKDDRARLMAFRDKIKGLLNCNDLDERDRNEVQRFYVDTTQAANLQEVFFERNGNEWYQPAPG